MQPPVIYYFLPRPHLYIHTEHVISTSNSVLFADQFLVVFLTKTIAHPTTHLWKREILLMGRWIKPEIYPLLVPMAFVTSLCAFQLVRNISGNPDVRVNKSNRLKGVLDNKEEGEKYAEHGFRRFLRSRSPEVMPTVNRFFTEDK